VFCVDNVSTSCCVNDIRAFASSQSTDAGTSAGFWLGGQCPLAD